jgi:hypothetical protein
MNKDMRIKNYTTDVPASRTQYEIEQLLVASGAEAIMKNYRGDGKVEALAFKYQGRGYKLPANLDRAIAVLEEIPGWSRRGRDDREAQGERISWRVIKDWLEAQIALMKIGQAEFEQVMLPYMWDGRQSLYDKLKGSGFMLPKGDDE